MKFVADKIIKGKMYPALAQWQATPYTQAWREFGQHWPYTIPSELFGHLDDHQVPYEISTEGNGYYLIALSFFDFSIDYIGLISSLMLHRIRSGQVKILFYYHEGDNPEKIKQRLDFLCQHYSLDADCYRFVSGNSAAEHLENFVYFADHELLYQRRNSKVSPVVQHQNRRPFEFLVLSRTHKWWRAAVMAQLEQTGILSKSLWSYNTTISIGDSPEDNPIEIQPRIDIEKFIAQGPYYCDEYTADQHNDHSLNVEHLWTSSYCSIILETHFDADGSGGAFLTEKTFKALKHGHPFVLVAPPGSLDILRNLGYRVFDHVIDNSYDTETNNTQRWLRVLAAIEKIRQQDMHQWYQHCWQDIKHNQELFLSEKPQRLNTLFNKLSKKND
jgi:hypothetical protein